MEAPTIVSLAAQLTFQFRAWGGTGGLLQSFLPGQFSSSSVGAERGHSSSSWAVIASVEVFLGLHPGQSSTAFGGAEHFPAATAEQIVDIPVPHGDRVLHPASSSSDLPGLANEGVFRTFPCGKKVRGQVRTRGSELSADSTPSTPASSAAVHVTSHGHGDLGEW